MSSQDSDMDHQISKQFAPFANEALINEVQDVISSQDLHATLSAFQSGQESFIQELKRFESMVKETPLITAFISWISSKKPNNLTREHSLKLLNLNLVQFRGKDEKLLKIFTINSNLIADQINYIRCSKHISFLERENFVETLLSFYSWLSLHTHGYVMECDDPDISFAKKRSLKLHDFIDVLKGLEDRTQLIAKLLYFGKNRVLEEVVNLQIEDVDFAHKSILFDGVHERYPPHVFEDIRTLMKERKSGPVFTGRNNSKMNPSTIFRHFQALGTIRGLENISPKTLTEDS